MDILVTGSQGWAVETVGDFKGSEAQPFVKVWNETPPLGNDVADEVVVTRGINKQTGKQHSGAYIILLNQGCAVSGGMIKWSEIGHLVPRAS